MALRPDAQKFVHNIIVETEILNTAKDFESATAGVVSLLELYETQILEQKRYSELLEIGYLGLIAVGMAALTVKFRKK